MHNCPICLTAAERQQPMSPYWICPNCDCWFQDPMPAKTLQNPDLPLPSEMDEGERTINRNLAISLFKNMLHSKQGRTLDVGGMYPVLANTLGECGCEAWAIDPDITVDETVPRVKGSRLDFEDPATHNLLLDTGPFDLITFIHVFEHMYDPVRALLHLRKLIYDNGTLFIRIPQHDVDGFGRDLTASHYLIHPYYHSRSSILQCLFQARTAFELASWEPFQGHGQADLVLRPIDHAPMIALGAIVKNEERDLPKMLDSLRGAVDGIFIIDTGSTDDTAALARDTGCHVRTYTGASIKDDTGDWKLQNFSKARNQYLGDIDRANTYDWILNLDADDTLLTPSAVRRASYWTQYQAYDCWIRDGSSAWMSHRFWRANMGIRYEGWCHEYPALPPLCAKLEDMKILHTGEPSPTQENANPRNLRILKAEWNDPESKKRRPRMAFYIGNTYKDAGKYAEAIEWYEKRIELGHHYYDEWLVTHVYCGRCYRLLGDYANAERILKAGLAAAPHMAEFGMELAWNYYVQKRHVDAIEACKPFCDAPITDGLFREINAYRDGPPRMISHCYYESGDVAQALAWAEIAAERIGAPDASWDQWRKELSSELIKKPSVIAGWKPKIALHRPGAIGDILMTLNLVPALREVYPEHQIHYFCDMHIGEELRPIMVAAGVDAIMDCTGFKAWEKGYQKVVNLIGYPLAEGYPDKPMKKHLIRYFAEEMGLPDPVSDYEYCGAPHQAGSLPALTLGRPNPVERKDYATLQTYAGWSKYKQWPLERWEKVVEALPFPVIHLHQESQPPVPGCQSGVMSVSKAIACLANARIHLGIDSFLNHASNFFWETQFGGRRVPAVILWGSTQASAAGYAHNKNISYQLPCQPCFREDPAISRSPRGPCIMPLRQSYADDTLWKCMDNISVDEVIEAAIALWEKTPGWKY